MIFALYVANADAVAERMIEHGASVVFPVADHSYGERGGRLRDPFGHLWMIAQRTENLTRKQIQSRTG